MIRGPVRTLAPLAATLALASGACTVQEPPLTVYAAASLQGALDESAAVFTRTRGIPVRIRYGSSGSLARLIDGGAPADVLVSAHPEWTEWLSGRGRLETREVQVAENRLAVVVPAGPDSGEPGSAMAALERASRISIGNPETVPAGRYAREALESAGRWDALRPRCILAPDVRIALARVERGEAEAGIVYVTDARASRRVQVAAVLAPNTHAPIRYPARVVAGPPRPEPARRFLDHLETESSRSIFRGRGFGSG